MGTRQPFPAPTRVNEAAALPSPAVVLSDRLEQYYGRLRLPAQPPTASRLTTGYKTARSDGITRRPSDRTGSLLFPLPPSIRSTPSTPGSSSGLQSRLFAPSMAFAVRDAARLSLSPPKGRAHQRRGRLRFMLRTAWSLPPTGLSTLGFDPAHYQTEPPACYRASWQLPGPDSQRLATTSTPRRSRHDIRNPLSFRTHSR
jgi:hypothetical protein